MKMLSAEVTVLENTEFLYFENGDFNKSKEIVDYNTCLILHCFLVNQNFAMNPTNIALSATVNTSTIIVNVFILFWVKVAIIFDNKQNQPCLYLVNIKMQCVHSEKVKESISIFLDVPWVIQ